MVRGAERREKHGLLRQIDTVRARLLRELAKFLLSAAEDDTENISAVLHKTMSRPGQTGELTRRVYELVGYPEWTEAVLQGPSEIIAELSHNRRTNVLLGTPLEAALRDPRWEAAKTLGVADTS